MASFSAADCTPSIIGALSFNSPSDSQNRLIYYFPSAPHYMATTLFTVVDVGGAIFKSMVPLIASATVLSYPSK